MKSSRYLALALVVAALTGCASPVESPARPSTPSGSPVGEAPTQPRETGLTRPAAVFDANCDSLFSGAELQAAMGEPLSLGANHWFELWGGTGLVDQAGGIMCTWGGEQSRVIAIALPEAAVQYEAQDVACGETHDSGYPTCSIEAVVNGIRLSALVTRPSDVPTVEAAKQALADIFSEKAEEQSPVPVPIPALGAWQLPPDCVAVTAGADFSAVPGLGDGAVDGGLLGAGKDSPQAYDALAADWFPGQCLIQGESAAVEFVPVGGLRWREEGVAARADATVLPLEGVDAAYAIPYDDGLTLVYAFDGPNMLMFTVLHTKNAGGIATALIASLNTTAAV